MKATLSILFACLTVAVFAQTSSVQEQEISTKIKAVRVYTQKAEITREVSASIPKGKSQLVFTGLSPEIDGGSIRLDGKGFTILSVKAQPELPDAKEAEEAQAPLLRKLEQLKQEIEAERARLSDIQQARKILLANQAIKGDANLTVMELRSAMQFFREQLDSNTEERIKQERLIQEKGEERQNVEDQIKALGLKEAKKFGKVVAVVEANQAQTTKLTLSYIVSNARWMPSYDIRFNSVGKPLAINYKANVQQSTGIDWKDVDLSISSGNPSEGGQAPVLVPWRLGYNTRYQPGSISNTTEVSGVVYDMDDQSPLPGVTVIIEGTTIGTVTDIDGRYNLSLPSSATTLRFSYIGYAQETRRITSPTINIGLRPDVQALEEVVVTGRASGIQLRGRSQKTESKKAYARTLRSEPAQAPTFMQESIALETTSQEYQTNFAYDIETPYTIPSDNQSYAVEMVRHEVPASYRYTTAPKLLDKAFLTAEITNWGKYNFLEGEANLFFENSFVGKTVLQLKQASDTLNLSIGRDERILVKRERDESFKEKKFIGTKRKESVGWNITVRNTKSEAVEITVKDHIPISQYEDIKVELEKQGGATLNEETGLLEWRMTLKPNSSRTVSFLYSVTYPKNRTVYLE